ncbi:related to pisatin demethylase [Cephalotrichum gorgonifer]|uniref:Related to pisatin demethylase n=1 Tax=Cephalotrichum gorgonifer TaxID=2041049 RepID=A0AAE8N427_9PEZI|nr:related to pisatin demethylase [Cephalotrichum gorgonifer]
MVRVRPNEVWFDSEEALKLIYNPVSGFEKSDFYLATVLTKPRVDWWLQPHFPDTLDLLSERDRKRYRLQRRLIGPVYTIANIKKYEKAIDGVIARTIAQIQSLDGASVDLKEWMHIIAVECLGAAVLSWSPGLLQKKTDGGSGGHGYLGWRKKSVFGLFPTIVLLDCLSKHLARPFVLLWNLGYAPPPNFKPFFTGIQRQTKRRLIQLAKGQKLPHKDVFGDLIDVHREKPEFTLDYLKRMTITNFGAGHETMASTLTSAVAMIASHPEVYSRVAEEVGQASKPSKYDNAVRLSYTSASIKESQRLHPVIGMSLSRKVPSSGMTIQGTRFPPGTTVGCCPISLHRNPDIFGVDPDEFIPDRWLEAEDSRRMERSSLIWGGGSRTCPGRQLAELVVLKVITALFEKFYIEVEVPPEDEMPVYFMSMMSGVRARFLERGGAGDGDGREDAEGGYTE